jgi:hypothetical protein
MGVRIPRAAQYSDIAQLVEQAVDNHLLSCYKYGMSNTKAVGERSEGMVLAALLRAGKVVLQPFGDNQRYDLVVDDKGRFLRLQCKTGRFKDGAILFDACSSQAHRGKGKQDYRGQIEMFAVYYPDMDTVYMVPVEDVGRTSGRLRLEAPKNGQSKGIRLADSYLLK